MPVEGCNERMAAATTMSVTGSADFRFRFKNLFEMDDAHYRNQGESVVNVEAEKLEVVQGQAERRHTVHPPAAASLRLALGEPGVRLQILAGC